MAYYIGTTPTDVINSFVKRYYYGLRRNDDGELFLIRIDQLSAAEGQTTTINDIGIAAENYLDFEEGIDFLDGINSDHSIEYDNLRYPQLRWDNRNLTYYIDPSDGQFIQVLSQDYQPAPLISSPGYGEGDDAQVITGNSQSEGEY